MYLDLTVVNVTSITNRVPAKKAILRKTSINYLFMAKMLSTLIKPSSELHFIAQKSYLIIDIDVTLLLQFS